MNKTSCLVLKGVLFAGIAATVSSVQGQIATSPYVGGDAIVAFTTYSGSDLIVNLGLQSSLHSGQSWNLSSLLTGNVALANKPTWAVLAEDSGNVYITVPHGAANPGPVSDFFGTQGAIDSIGQWIVGSSGSAAPSASATYSFSWENNPATASSQNLANIYYSAGGAFSGTSQVQDYYAADNASDPATILNPGQFTLTSAGLLTYGTGVVSQPTLTIARSGSNVILSWPTTSSGFTLQSNTSLPNSAGWVTVSPSPVIVGSNYNVTNSISGGVTFYRLSHP